MVVEDWAAVVADMQAQLSALYSTCEAHQQQLETQQRLIEKLTLALKQQADLIQVLTDRQG
jgi:peptidoglycan hydrolase CwlO-like protein